MNAECTSDNGLRPERLRIVFMGTPDFAARILDDVAAWDGGELVSVYARPDRPAGRGNKLKSPPVKEKALALGIPVFQPLNFKDKADVDALAALKPDVLVVAAYGLILPQCVLDIPRLGPYNVHASLLPQLRGAAPVQRAIMRGDNITGVTIMRMEAGLDSGPILLQQAVAIRPADTSGDLLAMLAEFGGRLMIGALGMLAEGRAAFMPQDDALATYAPKLTEEDERIPWERDAVEVCRHIRALSPEPGVKTVLHMEGKEPLPVRIEASRPENRSPGMPDAAPGTLVHADAGGIAVACRKGVCRITRLRPAGKASMSAADFANGRLRGLAAPYGHFA